MIRTQIWAGHRRTSEYGHGISNNSRRTWIRPRRKRRLAHLRDRNRYERDNKRKRYAIKRREYGRAGSNVIDRGHCSIRRACRRPPPCTWAAARPSAGYISLSETACILSTRSAWAIRTRSCPGTSWVNRAEIRRKFDNFDCPTSGIQFSTIYLPITTVEHQFCDIYHFLNVPRLLAVSFYARVEGGTVL